MTKNNQNEITIFAETTFRNKLRKFGIRSEDRRRHVYIIGKTGMGKTTLIENMVFSDILAGNGVCYVDPHGDTAEKSLDWIPTSRINDVIYFNPADIKNPISFNVLEKVAPEQRHLVASGLIGVFKKQWADSWGPRLEYILRNAILALLEYPDSTLLGINRMLVDKNYNKKVISKVTDPVVRSFWIDEYPKWNERVLQEVISPIQNKVGQFLSTSLIRNIVGQVKSSIDLRKVMDEGKILILNLSKGRIGEDASALLGAMIVTKIQLAAMSRVDVLEEERKDFYLYVDEFQNFATDSFADILSEARKYRLNLIIAHQYIEQLGEVVKPAVFGNVGTILCFRVGAADAEELVREFAPVFTEEDLVNLPKYEIYLRLMIDGVASDPFSARGLPPISTGEASSREKVIKVSRERYAMDRDIVEDKIKRWHAPDENNLQEAGSPGSKRVPANRNKSRIVNERKNNVRETGKDRGEERFNNGIYKHNANCSRCSNPTKVSFKPDGIRPVYCKDCLAKARLERRDEIENRKKAKKEELIKLKQEEISLKEALSRKPVDFKGKEIENRSPAPVERQADVKNNNAGELREGEEVEL